MLDLVAKTAGPAMAYDEIGNRLLMHGGYVTQSSTLTRANELWQWLFSNSSWTRLKGGVATTLGSAGSVGVEGNSVDVVLCIMNAHIYVPCLATIYAPGGRIGSTMECFAGYCFIFGGSGSGFLSSSLCFFSVHVCLTVQIPCRRNVHCRQP